MGRRPGKLSALIAERAEKIAAHEAETQHLRRENIVLEWVSHLFEGGSDTLREFSNELRFPVRTQRQTPPRLAG